MAIRQNNSGKHYKYKTEFFGLPVPGNEKLTVESEHHRWEIIENLLVAATKGIYCSVFEDGDYKLIDNVDGSYTVMLSSTGHEWALLGVINGGLVKSTDPVVWEGLKKGQEYWLYVQYKEGMFQDPSSFGVVARFGYAGDDIRRMLLLAKLDADGNLDTAPMGKVYGSDVARHVSEGINPHGDVLRQDDAVIKRLMTPIVRQDRQVEDLLLYDGTNGLIDVLLRRRIVTIETLTMGPVGMTIPVPNAKRILMATVCERVVPGEQPMFTLGNIILEYDSEQVAPGSVALYNSGPASVPVRLTIIADF